MVELREARARVGDFEAASCYRGHECLGPWRIPGAGVVHLCVLCRRTVCLGCCALVDHNRDVESTAPEDDARNFGHVANRERSPYEHGQNAVCYPCSERLAVMALGPLARQFVYVDPERDLV